MWDVYFPLLLPTSASPLAKMLNTGQKYVFIEHDAAKVCSDRARVARALRFPCIVRSVRGVRKVEMHYIRWERNYELR